MNHCRLVSLVHTLLPTFLFIVVPTDMTGVLTLMTLLGSVSVRCNGEVVERTEEVVEGREREGASKEEEDTDEDGAIGSLCNHSLM